MDVLIKNTCEDTAEVCYRWYYSLHVLPMVFSQYQKMNAEKNIYSIGVGDTVIYVDLDNVFIVSDTPGMIRVLTIAAWIGRREKKIIFALQHENRRFIWCYRHDIDLNISELYHERVERTDKQKSDIRRGKMATVIHDGIPFVCKQKRRLPFKLKKMSAVDIMVVRNEEPNEEDVADIASVSFLADKQLW